LEARENPPHEVILPRAGDLDDELGGVVFSGSESHPESVT